MPVIFKLISKLPHKAEAFFWLVLTSVITNVFSLVIPMFFLQVYDRIIPYRSEYTLVLMTAGAVLVIIIDTAVIISRGILTTWLSVKYAFLEVNRFMKKLFYLTNKTFYSRSVSWYDESFRAIDRLKRVYSSQLFQSMLDMPFILVFLYGIYYVGGELVYFHIAVLSFYIVFNFVHYFVFMKYKRSAGEKNNSRLDFIRDVLERIHPVKSQSFEEILLRKLEILQGDYSRAYFLMKNRSGFPLVLGEFLSQVLIYGTIVIGGIMVLRGELSLGIISAATMLARRIVTPLLSISRFSITLSEAGVDLEKAEIRSEGTGLKSVNVNLPDKIEGFLEFRNLSLQKEETLWGNLKEINLVVTKGSVTGIACRDHMAANLLVDILLGIEKPESGQILLDSLILSDFDGLLDVPEIAVIPRTPELFSGTILDNITLFNPGLSVQALDTAAFVGLDPLVAKLSRGYETEITSFSDKTLPAELIKRISIARAFVNRPRVIISNQADSSMNEDTRTMFLEILDKISVNTTIIILSDRMETLDEIGALYVLEDSRLVKTQEEDR